ncbi:unnamed protein product [Withania somnifera]
MTAKPLPTLSSFIDKSLVPGDVILDVSNMTDQTIKLGGGLQQYIPTVGDTVLGIVVDKRADVSIFKYFKTVCYSSFYKQYHCLELFVDIKGPMVAFLPVLAFEGGTRRNIPKFEVGTLIYARIVKANTGTNPELSCMDASGKAAEFGLLKDGYMFESSTGLSRMLLSSPTCPVLEGLGKKLAFEIAVGLNGRVWVNAEHNSSIILVANAMMNSESLTPMQQKIMVERLLERVS